MTLLTASVCSVSRTWVYLCEDGASLSILLLQCQIPRRHLNRNELQHYKQYYRATHKDYSLRTLNLQRTCPDMLKPPKRNSVLCDVGVSVCRERPMGRGGAKGSLKTKTKTHTACFTTWSWGSYCPSKSLLSPTDQVCLEEGIWSPVKKLWSRAK